MCRLWRYHQNRRHKCGTGSGRVLSQTSGRLIRSLQTDPGDNCVSLAAKARPRAPDIPKVFHVPRRYGVSNLSPALGNRRKAPQRPFLPLLPGRFEGYVVNPASRIPRLRYPQTGDAV